jgi:hypothetical protein
MFLSSSLRAAVRSIKLQQEEKIMKLPLWYLKVELTKKAKRRLKKLTKRWKRK